MGRVKSFATAEAQRLYRSGMSLRAVGDCLGVSSQSIHRRLVAAEEPIRSKPETTHTFGWTDEAEADLRRLFAEGKSAAEIARTINRDHKAGLSRSAVLGKGWRMGLKREKATIRATRQGGGNANRGQHSAPAAKTGRTAFTGGFKRPKLKLVIGGNGTVLQVPEAPPPTFTPPREIAATVAANPKPWTERVFGECAWPIDGDGADVRSCCNPTGGKTYCETHARVMVGSMPKSWAGFEKPGFAKVMGR